MLTIGQTVKVLAPFDVAFPDPLAITEVINSADGTTAYILGDNGGFDEIYLELV